MGMRGIHLQEGFEIEVLENGISGILRPCQHVTMSRFFI